MSDFDYPKRYDVIVLGAGHAGIEAAMAASRLGCETLMLTQNADTKFLKLKKLFLVCCNKFFILNPTKKKILLLNI